MTTFILLCWFDLKVFYKNLINPFCWWWIVPVQCPWNCRTCSCSLGLIFCAYQNKAGRESVVNIVWAFNHSSSVCGILWSHWYSILLISFSTGSYDNMLHSKGIPTLLCAVPFLFLNYSNCSCQTSFITILFQTIISDILLHFGKSSF